MPPGLTLDRLNPKLRQAASEVGAALCASLELLLNKGRQQLAIREVMESLTTIKTDVLNDVSKAVQTAMESKADEVTFRNTMAELTEQIEDLVWMKPEVKEWSKLKHQLAGLEKSHVDNMANTLDMTIANFDKLLKVLRCLISRCRSFFCHHFIVFCSVT